jgi:hypothetical protein
MKRRREGFVRVWDPGKKAQEIHRKRRRTEWRWR